MPKVSVIIPVYNVEKYLAKCLDSVINQTFKDIEIICIDDCSTDSSKDILLSYAKKDNRIKVFYNEVNSGLSYTRNIGIKNSSGKYIFFLDSDDMIIDNIFDMLYNCIENNNLDMLKYNYKRIFENKNDEIQVQNNSENYNCIMTGKKMFSKLIAEGDFQVAAPFNMYRTKFLIENELYFYDKIFHEDNLFSFLCYMKAERVMNINKICYLYRQHENSIMTTVTPKRHQSLYIVMHEIVKYCEYNNFEVEIYEAIEKYLNMVYCGFKNIFNLCIEDEEMIYGTQIEKILYRVLFNSENICFSSSKIEYIKKFNNVIVYGAGKIAQKVINGIEEKNVDIEITGVVVSELSEAKKYFMGHRISSLESFYDMKDDVLVLVAVSSKFKHEIIENLKSKGFNHYIELDNI